MTDFTVRPNPDVWTVEDFALQQEFPDGEIRIELWTHDGDQQWVLVVNDGGPDHTNEFTAIDDAMMAMLLRVMRHWGGDDIKIWHEYGATEDGFGVRTYSMLPSDDDPVEEDYTWWTWDELATIRDNHGGEETVEEDDD